MRPRFMAKYAAAASGESSCAGESLEAPESLIRLFAGRLFAVRWSLVAVRGAGFVVALSVDRRVAQLAASRREMTATAATAGSERLCGGRTILSVASGDLLAVLWEGSSGGTDRIVCPPQNRPISDQRSANRDQRTGIIDQRARGILGTINSIRSSKCNWRKIPAVAAIRSISMMAAAALHAITAAAPAASRRPRSRPA